MNQDADRPSGKALLSSRVSDADRSLVYLRARLFRDRIEFRGLGWSGWYRRDVPLSEVERVHWRSGQPGAINFVIYVHDAASIKLHIKKGGGLWKYRIEELLGQQATAGGALPGNVKPASAA